MRGKCSVLVSSIKSDILNEMISPGRIYASYLLKSTTAYIMLKYEFLLFSIRPANRAVGVIYVPPVTAEFSIRRTGAAS